MFQFSALPPARRRVPGFLVPGGLPHSEILGSQPASNFPRLIATCYVLHRLLAPRHPPRTLSSLTTTTLLLAQKKLKRILSVLLLPLPHIRLSKNIYRNTKTSRSIYIYTTNNPRMQDQSAQILSFLLNERGKLTTENTEN